MRTSPERRHHREGVPVWGLFAWAMLAGAGAGCAPPPDDAGRGLEKRVGALESDEITIQSMNYFRCATEGNTCTVGAGSRYVAFGANNSYLFKGLGGSFACTRDTFGGDPAPGVPKVCYFSNYGSLSPTVASIATEGGPTASANGNVAYGVNGAFFFKTINGTFTCDNSTFGNPINVTPKACYLAAPSYTRVAGEGEDITGLYNTPIAFGAGGKFLYRVLTGTDTTFKVKCDPQILGEPNFGVVKDCYKLTDAHQAATNDMFLSQEGTSWSVPAGKGAVIVYGSGRNGAFIIRSSPNANSGNCDNAFGDPDPGFGKTCWGAPIPSPDQGLWTKVSALFPGPGGPRSMQLLMDGTVIGSDASLLSRWYRLRPDSKGHYNAGTWQSTAITSHYARRGYASGVLTNGKYFVGGGEFVTNADGSLIDPCFPGTDCFNPNVALCGPNPPCLKHSTCEVFDPAANGGNGAWADAPDFPNNPYLGDGVVAPLPNSRLLVGPAGGTESMEFDYDLQAWFTPRSIPSPGPGFSEGTLVQLQNGKVFMAQRRASLYDPSARTWTNLIPWPANDPFDAVVPGGEGGPALTLYSGKVMIAGATGFNGLYDPLLGTIVNIAPTPYVPTNSSQRGRLHENVQVVMPTGNVLVAATNDFYAYKFLEYSPATDTFTDVSYGAPDFSSANGNLLQTSLPDGTILVADSGFRQLWIYKSFIAQLTTFGQPFIQSISGPTGGIYALSGQRLNGLTNGGNADDELQPYTSFPIVSLTTATQTKYAVPVSVDNTSIAPTSFQVYRFKIPSGMVPTHGTATVRVVASGLFGSNSKTISY